MSKKIIYTDEPMDGVRVIPDFLPSPQELALWEETVKITLQLTRASVEFFKQEANRHNTQYQRMIRRLLNDYATHQIHANRPIGGFAPPED